MTGFTADSNEKKLQGSVRVKVAVLARGYGLKRAGNKAKVKKVS